MHPAHWKNGFIGLCSEAIAEWQRHRASRMSAALAFYALLSMAPLLFVTILVMGVVYGDAGRSRTLDALQAVVGSQGAAALDTLAQSAHQHHGYSTFGSLVALLVTVFGASGVFVELHEALNTIWEVPETQEQIIRTFAIRRFWSFIMVLGAALLLLVSVASSAVLAIVVEFFEHVLPGGKLVWQWLNFGLSLSILSLLFALIFRVVPDAPIRWSDVWLGASLTALLFVVGNLLLGVYLGKSGVTSGFGGAGSVVALMLWVYYSAQIVFLGAEFTHVYARRIGSLRGRPRRSHVP